MVALTMGDATHLFEGFGLACRRGGRTVFAGLTFSLKAGEALVLRGPNGSGKSTALRLMAGLARPLAGELRWNGAEVSDDPEAHGIRTRFIAHLDAVKPALTVTENLTFWQKLWSADAPTAVSDALAVLGLSALRDFPARLLSAGQRHRLALARLLLAPAPLWLLDEPTNALDDAAVAALSTAIAGHRARGGLVIIAGHGSVPITGGQELFLDRFAAPDDGWED